METPWRSASARRRAYPKSSNSAVTQAVMAVRERGDTVGATPITTRIGRGGEPFGAFFVPPEEDREGSIRWLPMGVEAPRWGELLVGRAAGWEGTRRRGAMA